jgi:hypothetical protein
MTPMRLAIKNVCMNKSFQHLKGTPYMFNIDCGDPIFYVNVNVVNPIKNFVDNNRDLMHYILEYGVRFNADQD